MPAKREVRRAQRLLGGAGAWVERDRDGLAGERRVVDAQAEGLDHATVGGHARTGVQQDQVARHEAARVEFRRFAVAQREHACGQQILERLERTLRAVLLPEREDRVHDDHADDRRPERRHPGTGLRNRGGECETRGHPEDQRKEMRELAQ